MSAAQTDILSYQESYLLDNLLLRTYGQWGPPSPFVSNHQNAVNPLTLKNQSCQSDLEIGLFDYRYLRPKICFQDNTVSYQNLLSKGNT